MSKAVKFSRTVIRRGMRITARLLAIAALPIGISIQAGNFMQPVSFALQETTVTATPGLPVPPPGPRTYVSIALLVLLAAGLLAILLALAFRRPGAWERRNLRSFSLGFAGWFVANTLLWLWVNDSVAGSSGTLFINPVAAVPWLANLAALLLLSVSRRWSALLGLFSAVLANAIGMLLFMPVTATYQQDVTLAILAGVPFYLPPYLVFLNFWPG